ncbi:MAG: uncharacterized membrane protein YhaH (DUF805 family) [Motiliproteus sp.]|jgi:uncharacterized membrane protein YhaH (DUF805 family)
MECKYCKEEIQEGAIKCKHCGSMLNEPTAPQVLAASSERLSPFGCYLKAWKNYASFSGRTRRREYWFFILFNILVSIGLSFIDGVSGTFNPQSGMGLLGGLYTLAMIIPAIALGSRRLHDINRTGWWQLIMLIPLVGALVLIVFYATDTQQEQNEYGANPKQSAG